MIHTVYSNSYEVLRVCLMNNIEALGVSTGGSGGASLFERAFEKVPVITPNNAVEEDLRRAVADRDGICAGIDFMKLSSWMGFFSKEPMANIVGNEADWMIWDLLRRTGSGSFREGPGRERLRHYLEGRSDEDVWHLARRIAEVFVVYSTYRLDWVLDWLGMHPEMLNDTDARTTEQKVLERHPDFAWQRDLWRELASRPSWRGRRFLEGFPDMLRRLAASGGSKRVKLENDFTVTLPDALHVFVPFVVPPVMLPIIKAYAASGRDVWFYLLNPTSEYWYDLLPRRLFDWKNAPEGAELDGHPLLSDNGGSESGDSRPRPTRLRAFRNSACPRSSMRTPSVVCRREPVGSCRRTSSRDMRAGIRRSVPTWPLPTTATTSSGTAPIFSPACRTRS